MRKSWNPGWQVVAALMVLGAGLALAGNVRIQTEGDPDAHVFDVSDLSDGETRVFGEGTHQVTVTREGDLVRIGAEPNGERKAVDATCRLASDHCEIITHEGKDEKVMIQIERRLECKNGVGDCEDLDVMALAHGAGTGVWIEKDEECEGKGCTERQVKVVVAGDGADHNILFVGDDPHSLVQLGDKVMLRCPEGDATLSVDKGDADATYLCPKHSEPMQRVESRVKRVVVHEAKPTQPQMR